MEPEKKSNGALVGLIIIIIILILGGLYMWKSSQDNMDKVQGETVTEQDSEELNSLEADLKTTDTNTGVDASTVY